MNRNKDKVAIYIRVSTDEQANEGFSLQAQEDHLRLYAKAKGYEVYDIYSDEGYSGKDYNRPEIQRLFKDLSQEKFKGILVKSVDRISRRVSDVTKLIDDVLAPRKSYIVISDNNLDSSTTGGTAFIQLLATFAQYERSMIVQRVKAGMSKRAELGYWNGGRVLGYDVKNKKLEVNEAEADIVRKIFHLRAEGKGYKSIAIILNQQGFKTKRGRLFSICTIKTILENPLYIGFCRWGRHKNWSVERRKGKTDEYKLIKGIHESIVSEDLWKKVQGVNYAHTKSISKNRNFNGEFVLSGILRCPSCGTGMVMCKTQKRDKSGYHLYYMCQAFHSKGKLACKSNLIRKEEIEDKVSKCINKIILKPSVVDETFERIKQQREYGMERIKSDLLYINEELKRGKYRLNKLNKDYLDEKIRVEAYTELYEPLRKEIGELESEKNKLDRKIESAEVPITKKIIINALENFTDLYENATYEQKKSLLRAIIKKIEVQPNRKDIKGITYWFDCDNGQDDALLVSKEGRTVS
ncbi:recombinase family protein [Bacillus paranthracis]|uniref:recombinase family protein n=1 Tax=Bacillus paranthracis TaxID=2026186 RepID=UPI000B43E509|nr:recombinase family protein [Bacillus thuringiensis]MCU5340777.1 recombinase family protein [Bacillus cereus]MCX3321552.1 recombinase family protein [Bacillus paranthracis]MBH0350626.1 DNA recombinase [Bacillus thuringiensis]OTX99381.1 DNA recombinase [Bacillus thuringiensis serovar muju]HDR4582813.1 recombinase family protein [Bacillus cereus]